MITKVNAQIGKQALLGMCLIAALFAATGSAQADQILVSEDIVTSVTWTSDNVYNLQDQIYVLPGASLTIEAGTVVASSANVGGSLAITRGARIFALGTENDPIIMTSTSDVETWDGLPSHPTGKDPTTGDWRQAANEWGNLTIMGNALISASIEGGGSSAPLTITIDEDQDPETTDDILERTNTSRPDGLNVKTMEGLTAEFVGDSKVLYGGADDNDDSGTLRYVSIRYTGRVIGLGNELNGLSLGGIGRETDIDHVEIMNNVDDGIEIWGGTVGLKYVNIWNIGDDSFDIDQGWRGKAQFGLIVQGYSLDAGQGSGVGDNIFETDGAEDSDAQPVTTAVIYNFTAVGQPLAGDGGTAWRDNARVQYNNCIFMDLGERLVRFDDSDGDGANGYGYNGTLSWMETWETDYTHSLAYASTINAATPEPAVDDFNHPTVLYQAQSFGNLAQITDSVFYNNNASDAYTTAEDVGVLEPAKNNVLAVTGEMPIVSINRAEEVVRGGLRMVRVTEIDPRAANAAADAVSTAPADGFFTPADYRGGFSATNNWLLGWTAADAFGMVSAPQPTDLVGDLNNDGVVDELDLFILISNWHNETQF